MATTSTESKDSLKPAPLDLDPLVQAKSDILPDEQQKLTDHNSEAHSENVGKGSSTTFPAAATEETVPMWRPPCDENPANRLSMGVDFNYYRPLYLAALSGNWESARKFFERDQNAMTAKISISSMTALHVAVSNGQAEFVEKLIELMPSEALAIHDGWCYTPLHYAAMSGNIRIAKALVRKNRALLQITDLDGRTPLRTAAAFVAPEHKELVWFLAKETTDASPVCPFTGKWAGELIVLLTHGGFHDISLYLLQRYPNLCTAQDTDGQTLLQVLAMQPSNFLSGSRLNFWERWIYEIVPVGFTSTSQHPVKGDIEDTPQDSEHYAEVPTSTQSKTYVTQVAQWLKMLSWKAIEKLAPGIKRIQNAKSRHKYALEVVHHVCKQVSSMNNEDLMQYFGRHAILAIATICGVVEVVTLCLRYFPDLIWVTIDNKTLMQHAVEHRQEKIFNLLYERTAISTIQSYGPALQMQREMQWFKVVESFVHPAFKELRFDGKTAWHVFQDEHDKLRKEGQKWMEDTATSCMVVSALIATVVFAAAFTVPGGNINDKGIPVFVNRNSFKLFAASDALSLFSSLTSILMFLSILTSRYAEEDFLRALPKRMIIGLASLFIAIAGMMVCFGAALYLVLIERWEWVSIPIFLLSSFPVALFGMLQLPLFIQMVIATYGRSIFRPQKIW
ncbi:ankyrin repeat-containing protein [Cinnamomum micranthum f. kanehirae]|uniref:Ankyrin repeat-containing protein n=1 Tax=Cinnamomum micranthum f. kanehirae TaxID=337451 RepID=A0A443NAZ8_9MAGN|nr:ankyrin repeat-containing protein [Cinnamomum micranthum f. kanehirae]